MKNKIVFAACILTFLFMLGGCTVEVQEVDIPKEELQEYIYELALKTGYEGAYAEWISSVKGETGADGKKVELSTTLTHIIWRYEGEAEWRQLIAIEELHAEPGKSAYDIAVEYGFEGTPLEWLASLKGVDGDAQNSVKYADINDQGELILTLADGTILNAGKVTGKDAPGVVSMRFDEYNGLYITLEDGREVYCGRKPKCNHSYEDGKYIKEPTCSSDGIKEMVCYYCGVATQEYVPATKHEYTDWTVLVSNCLELIEKRVCTVCTSVEFRELSPSSDEHNFVDYKCQNCGVFNVTKGLEFSTYSNNEYRLSGLGGFSGNTLVLQSTYNDGTVTRLDLNALRNSNVKCIVIPNTVTSIVYYESYNIENMSKIYYAGTLEEWEQISFTYQSSNPVYNAIELYVLDEYNEWVKVR